MPWLPLLTLTLAAFAIGTTEFAVQGLLPEVAASLDVSIPQTGLLVTGYGLGVAVGGPLVAIATNGLIRKTILLFLLGIFIIGHVLGAIAPDYLEHFLC
jgi:DHA1 family inner membrane transport protein